MLGFLGRRVLLGVFTILAISVISFIVIQLPEGDWVDNYVLQLEFAGDPASIDEAEALREQYGLNKPLYIQYWKWVRRMTKLDFGYSYYLEVPVRQILAERIPFQVMLAGVTIVFTWLFAIPIGIYSAVRKRSLGDYTFTFLGFTGLAVPDFLLALILMYISFAYFEQTVGGFFSREYLTAEWSLARVWDLMKHLWIPAMVLGTAGTAALIRIMRNNLLDELPRPYVLTAMAKGLPAWWAILKYPVRVALNPLVSTIGYLLPALIGGSIIVSVVLSLPTLGPVLLRALLEQDMYLAGTIVLLLGALTVVGTLISDVLLVMIDPRIRVVGASE